MKLLRRFLTRLGFLREDPDATRRELDRLFRECYPTTFSMRKNPTGWVQRTMINYEVVPAIMSIPRDRRRWEFRNILGDVIINMRRAFRTKMGGYGRYKATFEGPDGSIFRHVPHKAAYEIRIYGSQR